MLWSRVYVALAKVIIHKLHGEVSLVEQDTMEFVILAYLESISKHSHLYVYCLMQLFSSDATIFLKEKDALKSSILYDLIQNFQSCQLAQNQPQISPNLIFSSMEMAHRGTSMY